MIVSSVQWDCRFLHNNHLLGKKKTTCDKIFASDGAVASSSLTGIGTGTSSTSPSLARRTSTSALLHVSSTTVGLGIGSELTSYLDKDTVA